MAEVQAEALAEVFLANIKPSATKEYEDVMAPFRDLHSELVQFEQRMILKLALIIFVAVFSMAVLAKLL